jgi:DNA-binding response OmpR family regulator
MSLAVYFTGETTADQSIETGLGEAGCQIKVTKSITDTLVALREQQITLEAVMRARASHIADPSKFLASNTTVLVGNVQAGALTMLEVLTVEGLSMPLTLLVDVSGDDVQNPLRAMKLGVREYLIPTDTPAERTLRARKLVEDARREISSRAYRLASSSRGTARRTPPVDIPLDLRWDHDSQTIFIGDRDRVKLSPVEARTFDLLFTRRGNAVSMNELIACTLTTEEARKDDQQIQLLRTHLARLRRRLESNPNFSYRIENVRGSGYVML